MNYREQTEWGSTLLYLHPPRRRIFKPGREVCGGDCRQRAMKPPLPADPPAASARQGDLVSAGQGARHGWQPRQSDGVRLTTAHHASSSITLGASAPRQANGGIDGGRRDRLVRARRLRTPARDHASQSEGTEGWGAADRSWLRIDIAQLTQVCRLRDTRTQAGRERRVPSPRSYRAYCFGHRPPATHQYDDAFGPGHRCVEQITPQH
jgi:hypothetical protein